MANKNTLLKALTSALLVRDMAAGGGASTLAAAAAAGDSVITLADATNFAVGDTVRVGSGSTMELATLAAGAVSPAFNLTEPLARAHADGEAVVEQAAYDLGDVTDAGVVTTLSRESTDVQVATRRLTYTILYGYGDVEVNFTLPGMSLENLAFALGIPLGNLSGTGASAVDPKTLVTDLLDIGAEQNVSLVCLGVLMDGTPIRVESWGIDPDYTGFSANLRRGTLAGVPARFIAGAGGRVSSNASAYVANTTYRTGKGKVFDALTEIGTFADGPTVAGGAAAATTIAAAVGGSNVAGQKLITVASGADIAVGDWLRLGTGETVEFHRVSAIAGAQVTLGSKLLRDQAVGTVVVEQTLTPFGNVSQDGVTIAFTGTVDRLREATEAFSIGVRPVSVRPAVSFNLLDYTPAAIARAAGLDPADVVGNTFTIDERLGTNVTDGVYIRGVLKDGSSAWIVLWGSSQDVRSAAISLLSSGQPSVPTAWVPASGILFMQHV